MYLDVPFVHRKYLMEDGVNYCFVGILRSGKSALMYQRIHDLLDGGVPLGRIIYVNFEDECLMEMTVADLNLILEVGYDLSGGENRMCFSMRSRTWKVGPNSYVGLPIRSTRSASPEATARC